MRTAKARCTVLALVIVALLAGCGGGSGSSNGNVTSASTQMGGAIQGNPLSLTGAVTTEAGTPSTADGIGAAAGFNDPSHITADGTNLYVTDQFSHTIRQIAIATGTVTTLAGTAGFSGSADGTGIAARFSDPDGITTDGANLYVTDYNKNTVRKIVIASGAVTTLAGTAGITGAVDGNGTAASFNHPRGITTDGTNLYVVDGSNDTIRKIVIASGAVTTIAGSAGVPGSADGIGTVARFNFPGGIATDLTNLYVADTGNNTIRKIVISSGTVTTLAGTAGIVGSADGTGAAASFFGPAGVTTDGANLYLADYGNSTIRKIVIASGVVTTLAGTAGGIGSVDGIGSAASFRHPTGIVINGTSSLYVVDIGNNTIRKIDISTGTVSTLAGTPAATDGTGAAAKFYYPIGTTTDGVNLYVTDQLNRTIRKIEISTGVVTTLAGSAGAIGSVDGTGAAAHFGSPAGITTDGTNLYVTDYGNSTIRKIVIATSSVTTLAGTAGTTGSADGIGAAASFNHPRGITTDGTNLYVLDTGNNTIRKIGITTGTVTTLAGTAGATGSADGTGAAARFLFPNDITTDGTNLYVADEGNSTIRKIVIATGAVTTIAGLAGSPGAVDGAGSAARLGFPLGITTDGTNLYVTDGGNNTVRKIAIASGAVTTLAGSAFTVGSADAVGGAARFFEPWGITTDGTHLYVADTGNNMIRRIN